MQLQQKASQGSEEGQRHHEKQQPKLTGVKISTLPDRVLRTTAPEGSSTRRCTSRSSGQPNQTRAVPSLRGQVSPPSVAAAAAAAVEKSCCSAGLSVSGEQAAILLARSRGFRSHRDPSGVTCSKRPEETPQRQRGDTPVSLTRTRAQQQVPQHPQHKGFRPRTRGA